MTGRHVPLQRRAAGLNAQGPYEGVPAFLQNSLWAWVEDRITRTDVRRVVPDRLDAIERAVEIVIPRDPRTTYQLTSMRQVLQRDDDIFLDVVDFLASLSGPGTAATRQLERILSEAGSVWTVAANDNDQLRLELRVEQTVRATVERAIEPGDRAAMLLGQAWTRAYGRHPDASSSYNRSVRAVEAIAQPTICPNDQLCTLGRMIGLLKANTENWNVVLNPPEEVDSVLAVASMMELLWKSQLDRHGTANEDVPIEVSNDETRVAVHLAATLVQFFRSDAITPS